MFAILHNFFNFKKMNNFKKKLIEIISSFDEIPLSEDDLKFKISIGLKENFNFLKITPEYPIPKQILNINNHNHYIDIMIQDNLEFIPIELKFKTKRLDLKRSVLGSKILLSLKNQQAQNLSKYSFWKDVSRIEKLKNENKNVTKGFQVFLTNDIHYVISKKNTSQSYNFNMANKRKTYKGEELFWIYLGNKVEKVCESNFKKRTFYNKKNITLSGCYDLSWNNIKIKKEEFYLLIVEI